MKTKSLTHDRSNSNIVNNNKTDSDLLKKKTSELKSQHRYISYQLSLPEKIQKILSSKPFLVIDILITLWMFYSNDLKLLYTEKDKDVYFSIVTIVVMAILFIKIVSLFIIDENEYGCSQYFWIDILSLGSMVFDLHFVSDTIHLDKTSLSPANKNHTEEFFSEYKIGFDDYIKGDWESAKFHFEKAKMALNSKSKNEPSLENLLKFMGKIILKLLIHGKDIDWKAQVFNIGYCMFVV